MSFYPENARNCCFSPLTELDLPPRPIYLDLFPASPGAQLQEITSGTFAIQLGQIRSEKTFLPTRSLIVIVFDPVGSEKYRRGFPATGHMEERETALDRSRRKVQLILRRETAVSHIFGAKARANVLISPLPTDCTSDCIRSGLKMHGCCTSEMWPLYVRKIFGSCTY